MILPAPSTETFEETHDLAFADRMDLAVPLRQLWRPEEIREDLLPWLAWALSIDMWDDAWPVEKKREVVAEWYDLHRYKGTEYGIRRHIEITGAKLLRAITPPQAMFGPVDLTEEERRRFLSRFRQIRIYPWYKKTRPDAGSYAGGYTPGLSVPMTFANGGPDDENLTPLMFAVNSQNIYDGYRRVAKLYEPRDGTETDLTHYSVKTTTFEGRTVEREQVVLPAKIGAMFFCEATPKAHYYASGLSVDSRLITLDVDRAYQFDIGQPQYHSILPRFDPIYVRPERIAVPYPKPFGFVTAGLRRQQFAVNMYAPESVAWQHTYDVLWIHDRDRLPEQRRGTIYGDVGQRMGCPPYHAELQIKAVQKKPRLQFWKYATGFALTTSTKPVDDAVRATRIAKAKRDRVLINTDFVRAIRFGDRKKFGFRFGDLTRRY